MIEINVCKAEPFGFPDERPIEDRVIIIDGKIPSIMSLDESEMFHERQAYLINRALSETLPQGTYDRLGIMFMQRKVSLYQGRTGM